MITFRANVRDQINSRWHPDSSAFDFFIFFFWKSWKGTCKDHCKIQLSLHPGFSSSACNSSTPMAGSVVHNNTNFSYTRFNYLYFSTRLTILTSSSYVTGWKSYGNRNCISHSQRFFQFSSCGDKVKSWEHGEATTHQWQSQEAQIILNIVLMLTIPNFTSKSVHGSAAHILTKAWFPDNNHSSN